MTEDGRGTAAGYLQRLMRQTGLRVGARSTVGPRTPPLPLTEQDQAWPTVPASHDEAKLTAFLNRLTADTQPGNAVTSVGAGEDMLARSAAEPKSVANTRQHAPAAEPGKDWSGRLVAEPVAAQRIHDHQPSRQSAVGPEARETAVRADDAKTVGGAIVSEVPGALESTVSVGPPSRVEPTEAATDGSPGTSGTPRERQQSWQATFKRVREWTAGTPAVTAGPRPAAVDETARTDEVHPTSLSADKQLSAIGSPEPQTADVVGIARPDEERPASLSTDKQIPSIGTPRSARVPVPAEPATADFKLTIGTISVTVEPPPETRGQPTAAGAGPQPATLRSVTPPPSQHDSSRLTRHYIRR